MKLRDYQVRADAEVDRCFEEGMRRVVVVAPTGAGKGTMAAHRIKRAAQDGLRVVFLVHRVEIVRDIADRLRSVGVYPNEVRPGQRQDPAERVHVCSVQTVLRRCDAPPADVVIVDECHHYTNEWGAILDWYPGRKIIGYTATPERADGKPLGDAFDSMVVAASYSELLAARHLVPCQVMRPPKRLGIDLAQDPVDAYLRYAKGSRCFLFARTKDDARDYAKRLNAVGVACGVVLDDSTRPDREWTMKRIADGRLTAVATVFALTEGVDVPAVQTIVLSRICNHESTFIQICGRALRTHPGKAAALLIDLTGASYRHGFPTDDREYSLFGAAKDEREGVSVTPPEERGEQRRGKVLGVDLTCSVEGLAAFKAGDVDVIPPDYKAAFAKWPDPPAREDWAEP